jgi:hypothetical protein
MKSAFAFALAAAAAGAVAGCAEFDPAARVNDLRVLAVRADAPYAAPGQMVHLEALAVDPAARPLTWGWALCVNPAGNTAPNCLQAIDPATVVIEDGKTTFDFTMPDDVVTSLPPDGSARASVGVAVAACPGDLALQTAAVPFRCTDRATGRALETHEYVVGVKRIFARTTDKNENPVIDGITWDGVDWPASEMKEVVACDEEGNDYGACTQKEQHVIRVVVPGASVESGVDSFGAPFTEQVVVQFYASEGIFEYDSRLAADPWTGWVARRGAAGRDVDMWFVLRDDRGGVTWAERRVRVTPR